MAAQTQRQVWPWRDLSFALTLSVLVCAPGDAGDWPMFRHDAARTGHTPEELAAELFPQWVYRHPEAPRPAWPRRGRLSFDRAYEPVIARDILCFGSSADGALYALDAATGRVLWTFQTDAPIRVAPAIAGDVVLAGSDDGFFYCLELHSGEERWRLRAAPEPDFLLGNEALISRWTVRGGPAVEGGVVYFAAGIWPSEGIHLYAVDIATGKVIWANRDSGGIHMPQPHGGAEATSGVSAQGHLVVTDTQIFLPTGRAVPAAFDRRDGRFQYYHLQRNGHVGGAAAMAVDGSLFNGGVRFAATSGELEEKLGPGATAALASGSGVVRAAGDGLALYQWAEREKVDRKGRALMWRGLEETCRIPNAGAVSAVITAGSGIVSGGDGRVTLSDQIEQRVLWSAPVEGVARALAVAGGRLYVSTEEGVIHCFGRERVPSAPTPASTAAATRPAIADDSQSEFFAGLATETIDRTGVTSGFCVDLGAGDGTFALELARRSNLIIYGVESDRDLVERARSKLRRAGLYGQRVVMHHRPLDATHYPNYFADLVVSSHAARSAREAKGRSEQSGTPHDQKSLRREAERLQRPYGGVIALGPPGAIEVQRRGPLAGAGSWTHQYADPANTICSQDEVKGRLRLLWFREVDQDLTQRHGRGPSPLFVDGMILSEGLDSLVAVSAYNGRLLWEYALPGILRAYDGDHLMGTAGTHSNYCAGDASVFVRRADACLEIDLATGKLKREIKLPEHRDTRGERNATNQVAATPRRWGYIATADGLLFGSAADPQHVVTYRYKPGGDLSAQLTESSSFFAIDLDTSRILWHYKAEHSIRHNAIAIGAGRVYLIDRPQAAYDRKRGRRPEQARDETGALLALDARSGEVLWRNDRDIYGTVLALDVASQALLMSYQPTDFRLASEVGGRLTVFGTPNGHRRWEKKAQYRSRPSINGGTIYAQGGAWDVGSGEERQFPLNRSYGCGILASGRHLMVFRSATLGYVEIGGSRGVENFGGMRPGCWINAIPAGGLVLVPDGSSGCVCSYQNKAWVALEGVARAD